MPYVAFLTTRANSSTFMRAVINKFRGKYFFLSNFYPNAIAWCGIVFPTNEHAFQAAKTYDFEVRQSIALMLTPSEAKNRGKSVIVREDWEVVKVKVMFDLLSIKFEDFNLRKNLLATCDSLLIEGNYWGDKFWGMCNGEGENRLGKQLMRLRHKIRKGEFTYVPKDYLEGTIYDGT